MLRLRIIFKILAHSIILKMFAFPIIMNYYQSPYNWPVNTFFLRSIKEHFINLNKLLILTN